MRAIAFDEFEATAIPSKKQDKTYSQISLNNQYDDPGPHERFISSYSAYYPEIIYEPSTEPKRNNISDASKVFAKKKRYEDERIARSKANQQVTQNRLEFEELDSRIKALRNDENRSKLSLRYHKCNTIHDLRAYKKVEGELFAKKPNMTLSDVMWGGHQGHQTVKVSRRFYSILFLYLQICDQHFK
jgi:hypothetical protein